MANDADAEKPEDPSTTNNSTPPAAHGLEIIQQNPLVWLKAPLSNVESKSPRRYTRFGQIMNFPHLKPSDPAQAEPDHHKVTWKEYKSRSHHAASWITLAFFNTLYMSLYMGGVIHWDPDHLPQHYISFPFNEYNVYAKRVKCLLFPIKGTPEHQMFANLADEVESGLLSRRLFLGHDHYPEKSQMSPVLLNISFINDRLVLGWSFSQVIFDMPAISKFLEVFMAQTVDPVLFYWVPPHPSLRMFGWNKEKSIGILYGDRNHNDLGGTRDTRDTSNSEEPSSQDLAQNSMTQDMGRSSPIGTLFNLALYPLQEFILYIRRFYVSMHGRPTIYIRMETEMTALLWVLMVQTHLKKGLLTPEDVTSLTMTVGTKPSERKFEPGFHPRINSFHRTTSTITIFSPAAAFTRYCTQNPGIVHPGNVAKALHCILCEARKILMSEVGIAWDPVSEDGGASERRPVWNVTVEDWGLLSNVQAPCHRFITDHHPTILPANFDNEEGKVTMLPRIADRMGMWPMMVFLKAEEAQEFSDLLEENRWKWFAPLDRLFENGFPMVSTC